MSTLQYTNNMFVLPVGTEMTADILSECIQKHKTLLERYNKLQSMYEGNHDILSATSKDSYKPDNRLVANFAKYIVDTLGGYFIGIPIKLSHDDKSVFDYLEYIDQYNGQDDNNAELAKMCDIYGHGFELLFTDEDGEIGITTVPPQEAFVVYDDSLLHRPMYGVRYYKNADNVTVGSFSDNSNIIYFKDDGGYQFDPKVESHYFGGVPLIEYIENAERQGAFEGVETLINAYDKALSEKANDVDYYADAYLLILGAALEEDTLQTLRDSRIINLDGHDTSSIKVEFLQKPDSDGTQENLINRLERLIYQLSMVANINDENFGNASGISLAYKLQSMSNLAKTKERKFIAGLQKRYKLIANCPASKMKEDDWAGITYQFTRNIPANLLEETQIAGNLAGITSQETQLKVLSCVDNVQAEMEKMAAESEQQIDTFTRGNDNIYKISSIINKYQKESITEAVAKKLLKALGLSDGDIDFYLSGGIEVTDGIEIAKSGVLENTAAAADQSAGI